MPNNAHVHGWPRPRSPFVLAAGAVLVGSVLFSAVLLVVGIVPAWGGARLVEPGAANQVRTASNGDPDLPDGPGGSSRDTSTWPTPKPSKNPPVTTKTDPPTTGPPTESPAATGSPTPDPKPIRPTPVNPPSAPGAAPAGQRARPAGVPQPTPTAPGSPPIGGFAPGRVPDAGSHPSVVATPDEATSGSDVAAARVSFLPGKEMGIMIFAAGLVALIVAIGGLVTLALRRRQY